MRRQRHAEIVATLGPASSDQTTIRALFDAGADVLRFNFSHGSQVQHRERHAIVRRIEQETGRPIAILLDLQGPKRRVRPLQALTQRAGYPRAHAGVAVLAQAASLGCGPRLRLRPWPPRRGCDSYVNRPWSPRWSPISAQAIPARAARERPVATVLSTTPELGVARRLALVWGVHSAHAPQGITRVSEMVDGGCRLAREEGFAEPGDIVVIAAGVPFGTAGTINLLHIAQA